MEIMREARVGKTKFLQLIKSGPDFRPTFTLMVDDRREGATCWDIAYYAVEDAALSHFRQLRAGIPRLRLTRCPPAYGDFAVVDIQTDEIAGYMEQRSPWTFKPASHENGWMGMEGDDRDELLKSVAHCGRKL